MATNKMPPSIAFKTKYSIWLWYLIFLMVPITGFSHSGEQHAVKPGEKPKYFTEEVRIGVEEKTGDYIPLDLIFKNELGETVVLGDLIQKPTLLLPAFFFCVTDCGIQISFLATGIKNLGGLNFKDFQVITWSFDPEDTPNTAAESKKNYVPLVGDDFPEENWRFLVGDYPEIKQLLDAIGYRIRQPKKNVFDHPNTLVVLGADGKIVRYLYGPRFLPFDIGMALTEAQAGRTGVSIRKVLAYCIDYDVSQKRYSFQYIRVFGIIIPLLLFLFYFLFLRKGNQT